MAKVGRSKLEKLKGRKPSGRFSAIPHALINSAKFQDLSGNAVKLLIQLSEQYNGKNNGDITASFNVLKDKGWKSPNTLNRALKELRELGFLVMTRQGHYPKTASLFALTWCEVDKDLYGKYDASAKAFEGKNLGWWKN